MELVFSGTIVPLLNEQIVKEYRDVLSRPKFHLTDMIIGNVINEIDRLGLYLDAETTNVILPDPKDTVFYEIVMEKRKTEDAYLVTGNIKHFPSEPFIVTPREMMTMIVNADSD